MVLVVMSRVVVGLIGYVAAPLETLGRKPRFVAIEMVFTEFHVGYARCVQLEG